MAGLPFSLVAVADCRHRFALRVSPLDRRQASIVKFETCFWLGKLAATLCDLVQRIFMKLPNALLVVKSMYRNSNLT
ncbi:hypothetical protein OIU79_003033 [Salix purpurea]|uniref:Uncharacterized protein n=1 Tax=Salix purpurea TaxID=77065 RepID=A0A9Q0UKK4_SALPP|nr:hypothetical protein OIU79_003033 [Salix purpurea]